MTPVPLNAHILLLLSFPPPLPNPLQFMLKQILFAWLRIFILDKSRVVCIIRRVQNVAKAAVEFCVSGVG
jgi:hypothetical protein